MLHMLWTKALSLFPRRAQRREMVKIELKAHPHLTNKRASKSLKSSVTVRANRSAYPNTGRLSLDWPPTRMKINRKPVVFTRNPETGLYERHGRKS